MDIHKNALTFRSQTWGQTLNLGTDGTFAGFSSGLSTGNRETSRLSPLLLRCFGSTGQRKAVPDTMKQNREVGLVAIERSRDVEVPVRASAA